MTRSDEAARTDGVSSGINRRSVLKLVGGSAVGIAAMSGTASAWQFQFYGCSQVCSDSRGARAVVSVDGGYECRPMKKYNSDRQNQDWGWRSACYETDDDESVVGVVESCVPKGDETTVPFCVNPNNCASNHYGSVEAVIAALNENDCCDAKIVEGDNCDVSGTGNGNGNGDDKGGNGDDKGGNGDGNSDDKGGNGDGNSDDKGGNGDGNSDDSNGGDNGDDSNGGGNGDESDDERGKDRGGGDDNGRGKGSGRGNGNGNGNDNGNGRGKGNGNGNGNGRGKGNGNGNGRGNGN